MSLRRAQALARYTLERIHYHVWRVCKLTQRGVLERNLMLLHDTLEESPLAGRFWVWGGVLLGWAREGRLLPHDTDVDLAIFRKDIERFRSSVGLLEAAGFALSRAFVNNLGEITEYVFVKDYIKLEFFVTEERGNEIDYWIYYPPEKLEMHGRVPAVKLSPMRLVDRTWLKPEDHEAHLEAVYGDWRTSRSDYWYVRDEKSIVSRYAWKGCLLWAPSAAEIR
jgi:hypothetical protein